MKGCFSQKSLDKLKSYVYALIDPRDDKVFYIGKGEGNRVFQHTIESHKNPNSERQKLYTIKQIESSGLEVKHVIVNYGLDEQTAYACEAALINLLKFTGNNLSNIVSGWHVSSAMDADRFEFENGAERLCETDIKDNLMIIKINRLYKSNMSEKEIYDTVRGFWHINIDKAKKVDYVLGVYNQLIVGVYKPSKWFKVFDDNAKPYLPRPYELKERADLLKRVFFVSENGEKQDINNRYYGKSIELLRAKKSQNPITYIFK